MLRILVRAEIVIVWGIFLAASAISPPKLLAHAEQPAGHNIVPPAAAPPPPLVLKPFLQQLTDSGVIILWATESGSNPQIRFGTDTTYQNQLNGTTRTVTGLEAEMHRVALSGLSPDTVYYYKIYTDDQDMLPAETLSFRTAPATGSSRPFTFLAFGDYGRNSDSQKRLRDQMLTDDFSFILTTGDNDQGDGTYPAYKNKVFWIYEDIFSRAAIFPAPGNHDYRTDNGAPYLDIFELPTNILRTADHERYYSFDFGNVHFVSLDSISFLKLDDADATDDMFDWLRQDLTQTAQPWKVVTLHHPVYSTGPHGSNSRAQSKLMPIFETHHVDLVFSGNDHTYQRITPMRAGKATPVDQGGIAYLVSGAGGQANYKCGNAAWLVFFFCRQPDGLYARISVSDDHLTVDAVNQDGAVLDSFTIEKELKPAPSEENYLYFMPLLVK